MLVNVFRSKICMRCWCAVTLHADQLSLKRRFLFHVHVHVFVQ